ncbi:FAD-binding oxidoreductase [Mycolicibacterium moriokaense]|nr:FAD-binding oxidoreductase [Mycolicibacterium moriokaense]
MTVRHFLRGADGYEQARRAAVWNGRLPDRFPDVIVQAEDAEDVVAAMRYAAQHDYQVGVRSGGHSWAGSHLRDGGMLLDVSRLDDCVVESERMMAVVGPGKVGSDLAKELDGQGLFFPAGHCEGICVGGYLLQGGYGWHSRVVGPACESVIGIDVVTADGEKLYCDPDNNAELYWAARGSGPGFFAVVTSFHLRLHPRPPVCGSCLYIYPVEAVDDVFTWAVSISPEIDDRVELQIITSKNLPALGLDQPSIVVSSPAFADTEEEAQQALSILGTCPALDKAIINLPYATTDLSGWYGAVMSNYPAGHRYAADNMWTSASAEDLLPGIHRIIETMPPPPSHFLTYNWSPSPSRTGLFYGLEAEFNLALYAVWQDPAEDEAMIDWPTSNMAAMAHLSSGIGLADENLGRRPAKFAADEHMARLDRIRATYDPDGRFHSWMGRC